MTAGAQSSTTRPSTVLPSTPLSTGLGLRRTDVQSMGECMTPVKSASADDSGKTLGGSSSINGMTQTRGQKAQYDAFAEFFNGDDANGTWNWDGILAGMKKSEGMTPPDDNERAAGADWVPEYHNTDGPLGVGFPSGIYQGDHQKYFKTVLSTNLSVPASEDGSGGEAAVVAFWPNVSPL